MSTNRLTAHQRLAIRHRLPEVHDVQIRADQDPIEIFFIRLELSDGSTVVIYGVAEDGARRCRRTRIRDDYSDRAELLAIDPDLRDRLVSVFGPLIFGPKCDAQ